MYSLSIDRFLHASWLGVAGIGVFLITRFNNRSLCRCSFYSFGGMLFQLTPVPLGIRTKLCLPVFTPAPGYRYYGNGALYAIGTSGYSWASSVPTGSSYAHLLGFDPNVIYPQYMDYRTLGRQVRCLQE